MNATNLKTRLTKSEIDALVAEREAKLEREDRRQLFEKKVQSLLKRMHKDGFYITFDGRDGPAEYQTKWRVY